MGAPACCLLAVSDFHLVSASSFPSMPGVPTKKPALTDSREAALI